VKGGGEGEGVTVREGEAEREGDGGEEEGAGDRELNMELLRTLRYAERGVKRMVKGIPEDEAGA
jgi:hypothetical protein